MYDANTGNQILKIANVPPAALSGNPFSDPTVEGPNGELLDYVIGNNWLAMWNSSLCIQKASTAITGNIWQFYPPVGATLNFATGIQWNVTTPNYPGQMVVESNSGIVLVTDGSSESAAASSQLDIAYDATTGQQLWVQNRTYPSPSNSYEWSMGPMANGVYTTYDAYAEEWYAFSTATGQKLWTSAPDPNPWGSEASFKESSIANGILYGLETDGVSAYNLTTGQVLWRFDGTNTGTNVPGFQHSTIRNNKHDDR